MGKFNSIGLITRVTAWIALAIEVVDFAGNGLGLSFIEHNDEGLKKLGILLFLISLVSWLESSNKALAKLDEMASQLARLNLVAKYGSSAVWLAQLLHPHDDGGTDKYPHCRAGGEALSQLLLNTYTQNAVDFHELRRGDRGEVRLKEYSVINLFLKNLVTSLPPGSVWFGVSRLQDSRAWKKESAEESYLGFEKELEDRAKTQVLTCFRVLCFENEARSDRMARVAQRQIKNGLHVRRRINSAETDLSLIWVPTSKIKPRSRLQDPLKFLEDSTANFEPLCCLEFTIRGGREVDTVTLSPGFSEKFSDLKDEFRDNWENAEEYSKVSASPQD